MAPTLKLICDYSSARPLPGLVWAVRANRDGATQQLEKGAPVTPIDSGWYWLHFGLADNRTHGFLDQLSLPAGAAELVHSGDEVQQIHIADGFTYGLVADMQRGLDGAQDESGFLHFIMTDRILITARRSSLHAPGAALQALQRGLTIPSVEGLLEHIIMEIVEGFDARIEKTADDVDRIEDRIIAGIIGNARPRLGASRRLVVRIHRHVTGLRTMLQRLNRNAGTSEGLQTLASNIVQQSEQLEHEIYGLRERTRLLQEEVAAMLAEETNKHLRVLSILSILFIPPTFIGGLFGMNLKGILFADMEHGFLAACLLAAACTGAVVWILRRSGILGRGGY
jgi:zinc transporter